LTVVIEIGKYDDMPCHTALEEKSMRYTNGRGRNRVPHTKRSEAPGDDIHMMSDAEYYLAVGRVAIKWRRAGYRRELICRSLALSSYEMRCAQSYAQSSWALILRAVVEEWTWPQIKAALFKSALVRDFPPPIS